MMLPSPSYTLQEKFDMAKRDFQYCWRNSLTKVVTVAICVVSLGFKAWLKPLLA